jgi:hypothetical protein
MLQPHSFLWHYLWVGPHALQLVLAILLWRRQVQREFPAFFAYLVFAAIGGLTLWALDMLSLVSAVAYGRSCYATVVVEGLLTLAVVWELFSRLLHRYPARVSLGRRLIALTGALLALLAALAARNPVAPGQPALVAHLYSLLLGLYIVLSGLMLFLFLFAAYHGLTWDRRALGIALGFSIDWCEHAAGWALIASGLGDTRLDFLNASTYHLCVLLWFYYLLSPEHPSAVPTDSYTSTGIKTNPPIHRIGQKLQPARLLARL